MAWLPEWLPGMGFKRKARKWNAHYTALAEEGHQMVKNELVSGPKYAVSLAELNDSDAGEGHGRTVVDAESTH